MPRGYFDLLHGFPTRRAVRALYRQLGTWKRVASALGGTYSPAYWCEVAHGDLKASAAAENLLRRVWTWPPKDMRRLDAMDPADLARAIRNRREVENDPDNLLAPSVSDALRPGGGSGQLAPAPRVASQST